MWPEVVRRTCRTYRTQAGLVAWIELQTYLPMLAFYAVGLGATAGDRFTLLKRLFETKVRLGDEATTVAKLLPYTAFRELDSRAWSLFTAPTGSVTALSNRLLDMFTREVPELAGGSDDDADLFDRFEVMAAFALLDQSMPGDFKPDDVSWMPPGRFVWRIRHRQATALITWLDRADAERDQWPPIAAGLFGGSFARFQKLRAALEKYVEQTRW